MEPIPTKADASRALKIVHNYLEDHKALNKELLNKLNEMKFMIDEMDEETKTTNDEISKDEMNKKKGWTSSIFGCGC